MIKYEPNSQNHQNTVSGRSSYWPVRLIDDGLSGRRQQESMPERKNVRVDVIELYRRHGELQQHRLLPGHRFVDFPIRLQQSVETHLPEQGIQR